MDKPKSKWQTTEDLTARLGRIVEDSMNEIFVFDSQTLKFEMVNRGARENLGYSIRELASLTPVDIKPDYTEEAFRALVHPLADGEVDQLVFSTVHQRKDGSLYNVEVLLSFSRSSNHSVFFAIIQDVTERLKVEDELRLSEERYALAVKGSADGLWDWNLQTGEVYLSPRWKKILGYDDDELPNTYDSFANAIHPKDRETVENLIKVHLEQRKPYDREFQLRHKEGHYVWVHAKGQAIWDEDGKASRMAGSLSDISKRKKAQSDMVLAKEQAEQANEAKSRFLALMSHELRTPLNAILGFSEVMAKQRLGPIDLAKYSEYAEDIHQSAEYLHSLIDDLLDMSVIEAGHRILNKEDLSVEELITDCFKVLDGQASDAGIVTEIRLLECPTSFYADKKAIKQILLNLLSNSVKNTPPGGNITLSAKSSPTHLLLIIEDTGKGIESDKIPEITDAFTKGEQDPLRSSKGWGLGLAISRSLAELHNGELIIESNLGEGTTVTVSLPYDADSFAKVSHTPLTPKML
jgi:PAS domain S-box-containing protein